VQQPHEGGETTVRLVDFCRPAGVLNLKLPAEKNKNRQQPFEIQGLQEQN
jgi:hypothetical protein